MGARGQSEGTWSTKTIDGPLGGITEGFLDDNSLGLWLLFGPRCKRREGAVLARSALFLDERVAIVPKRRLQVSTSAGAGLVIGSLPAIARPPSQVCIKRNFGSGFFASGTVQCARIGAL